MSSSELVDIVAFMKWLDQKIEAFKRESERVRLSHIAELNTSF